MIIIVWHGESACGQAAAEGSLWQGFLSQAFYFKGNK